jgi:hypothetical protein
MSTLNHISFLGVDLDVAWPYLVVGLLAIVVVWVVRKRTVVVCRPTLDCPRDSVDWEDYDPRRRYGDKRTSNRRQGGFVPLFLSSPAFTGGVCVGVVLDRSTGGLRIASEVEVRPGQPLNVIAEAAPPGTPWVAVTVRNCTKERNRFILGCEFATTPPWNVLLLFGWCRSSGLSSTYAALRGRSDCPEWHA